MPPVRDTKLSASAGEHHVCSMLARCGWAPSLTRDGLARTDILAVQASERRRMIEVQVKTVRSGAWLLGRKGLEPAISDREWYVLVLLGRFPDHPQTWVVPRDHIAAATWVSHMSWLRDPAAPPGTRNTPIENARFKPAVFEHYRDRWELLDQPATSAPVLLAAEMREKIPRVGLPPGHPWHQQLPPFADLAQHAGDRAAADQ